MLVKFSGVESERTISKFKKKEKENVGVVFTYSKHIELGRFMLQSRNDG